MKHSNKRLTRNLGEVQAILRKQIYDYCNRHNYEVLEIKYDDRTVFYHSKDIPWDVALFSGEYECFDYLEVDLLN